MNESVVTSPASVAQVVILDGTTAHAAAAQFSALDLGSKAHNLLRMQRAGLSVPPAFVLPTATCRAYLQMGPQVLDAANHDLRVAMQALEAATGCVFGGNRKPLLISVRSGAPVSMPGMLETILNIGLNEKIARAMIRATGSPRLVWDSYRRLVQSFAEVVHAAPARPFEQIVGERVEADGIESERDLDALSLRAIARRQLELFREVTGDAFPSDPWRQLRLAIEAVFRSWSGAKAMEYRRMNAIDDSMGTAATVQAMVFGNAGMDSGSGVAFTRDPSTGENRAYIDFLPNAQGEDVVAGGRHLDPRIDIATAFPAVSEQLQQVASLLEQEFLDMQDFEFTVQYGRLYLLQTRAGKRTPWAALLIAVDQVREGLIDPTTALKRLETIDLSTLAVARRREVQGQAILAAAVSASAGVASGVAAFDVSAARRYAAQGISTILVRENIVTEDIGGLSVCSGVLSATGGRTSHAAVVARELNRVCLVGCSAMRVEERLRRAVFPDHTVAEGEMLTLDGDRGLVLEGRAECVLERPTAALEEVRRWQCDDETFPAALDSRQ